jgi:ATP-binding cassette, subfamily G (WHITE), member 2, SNQ2
LVLGCPGAGCTTFLKTIANERHEYASVAGDVRYAGIDAAEMAKMYKGEVVYNQEGELLLPQLSINCY